MSVLSSQFNDKVVQTSPIRQGFVRVVKYDENGAEVITYEPEDCKKIQAENGTAEMWTLDALMKAGINPETMNVRTGYATRLDGISTLGSVEADIDAFIASQNNNESKSEE